MASILKTKADKMAATLDLNCVACGEHHLVCLCEGDLPTSDAAYEYICPVTLLRTQFFSDGLATAMTTCPSDSTVAHRVF